MEVRKTSEKTRGNNTESTSTKEDKGPSGINISGITGNPSKKLTVNSPGKPGGSSPGKFPQIKRKRLEIDDQDDESDKVGTIKPPCIYGRNCYRKNPTHLKEYSHEIEDSPSKRKKQEENKGFRKSSVPFFFTKVHGIHQKYNHSELSLDLSDILSLNSEDLVESCQFNYMFDIPWLLKKYPKSSRAKPILLVHGESGAGKLNLESEAIKFKNIDLVQAKLPIAYGTHHTKMIFLLYVNGCRVIIHTANLIEQDWHQKTQGIWVSPLFTQNSTQASDSNDLFKKDLFEYISSYRSTKLSRWKEKLQNYDMTTAGVHLIASIPGRHGGKDINKWGHLRLKKILLDYGPIPELVNPNWPVIGQFSSIGSLGKEAPQWLTSEWLESFSQCKQMKKVKKSKDLKLIFPSMENVRNSLEGYSAGGSLPFSAENATKQRWMREYLCEWKSERTGRSRACPHIKSYARLSPEQSAAVWFLLTSANLSKAAWGWYEKNNTQLAIRSYEIGVLLTPSTHETFDISNGSDEEENLQLPYDVPLSHYTSEDKPWIWNIRYTKEDSHGKLWHPVF